MPECHLVRVGDAARHLLFIDDCGRGSCSWLGPAQWNAYAYSGNNPISFSDPSGLRADPYADVHGNTQARPLGSDDNPYVADSRGYRAPNGGRSPGAGHGRGGHDSDNGCGDGPADADIERAKQIKKKTPVQVVLEQGGQIVMGLLGVDDIVDCATKGDIAACGMTLAGFMPWGKGLALLKEIPTFIRAAKAVKIFLEERKWAEKVLALGRKGCHSFDPDTKVLMADGTSKKIKDVKLGDKVLATDPIARKTYARAVTTLYSHTDTDLAEIKFAAPSDAQALETTQNHPFWDVSRQLWADAADLQPGKSALISPDGSALKVLSIRLYSGKTEMRDLTVDDTHTYYVLVGTTPVLVHNNNGDLCDIARGAAGKSDSNNTGVSAARDGYTGEVRTGESGAVPGNVNPGLAPA